jgi:hypothetical protein
MADFLKKFLSQFQIETGMDAGVHRAHAARLLHGLSVPGKTCFQIALPLQQTGAY